MQVYSYKLNKQCTLALKDAMCDPASVYGLFTSVMGIKDPLQMTLVCYLCEIYTFLCQTHSLQHRHIRGV